MGGFVLVSAVTSNAVVAVPCLAPEGGALLPDDTTRAVIACLRAGRDGAPGHEEGFDALVDRLERALGDRDTSARRAMLYGEALP